MRVSLCQRKCLFTKSRRQRGKPWSKYHLLGRTKNRPSVQAKVEWMCWFSGDRFFFQGPAAALILGRLRFVSLHTSGSPWYDSISYFSLRTRSFRSSPRLCLTLTFYHWQLALIQMQFQSYMTAVSLMTPPHSDLNTPWPKSMLDSLRYLRTFPRREDRCFCTSSSYKWSASLSYISTWQPWTFVDTWRHAASLAADKGRLECRRHPSTLLCTRETIMANAANQPLGRQAWGSRAWSRLSTCCYCWLIGLGHINDTYCDALCMGLPWL